MIRDLLVATDGTPVSRPAEDLAVALASAFRGRLVAVSVLHVTSEEERGDAMAKAMEALTAFKTRAHAAGVEATVRLEKGAPAETIVRVAKDESVHAIVVGTSGRGGLAHALLGSVAEKIARQADRTVIIAK